MAAIQALTAQAIAAVTTSPNTTFREACRIAAGSFTAGAKYLIIVSANARQASSANESILRLMHNTTAMTDGVLAYEQTSNTQETNYGWMYLYTQPGTTEDIILEFASSSTQVVTIEIATIVALNMDNIGTQGTDYYFDEVTADYTTTTSFVDQAAVTFTPNGTDDYLIVAQGTLDNLATGSNHQMRINDSVAGALVTIDLEGEDNAEEQRGHLLMTVVTPTNASHTFSAQFSHESAAKNVMSSRIFAISLNKFDQHAFSSTAGQVQPAAPSSWTTLQTVSPTPDVTGDWLVWGYYSNDIGTGTDDLATRLQINPSGGGLASDPAYTDSSPGIDGWDPTDIVPMNLMRLRSLTSGAARDINFDAQLVTGTTLRVQERTLVAFSMELPGVGGGISIPVVIKHLREQRIA